MDTEAPTLDHADASILESWNSIRPKGDGDDAPTLPVESKDPESKIPVAAPEPRQRDASGKFAKIDPEPAAPEPGVAAEQTIAPEQTQQTQQAAEPVIESPRSMPRELADKHWAALPAEVKAWTQKRDADYEAGIGRYKDRAARFDSVEAAFAPYQETLQRLNAQPEQAVAQLLSIDHILRTGEPQVKAAMLAQIAQQFGVPLDHLPQVGPLQQQLLAAQQELLSLKSQQTGAQAQQAQRELESLTGEVVKFSEGKAHFGAVQSEMLALLPSLATQMPNASPAEKLQRAYDIAVYANPSTRAALEAQQHEAARQEALKKATVAKAAAVTNRTPKGVVSTVAAVGTMEDTIRAEAKRLGL